MSENHGIVRTIYLYLFALVGLFIFVFSAVNGVGAVLDRYVFPQEFVDYESRPVLAPEDSSKLELPSLEEREDNFAKQQDNDFRRRMNSAVPGALIGYGLWVFHWREIRKDRSK